jgi:hypothetical protein
MFNLLNLLFTIASCTYYNILKHMQQLVFGVMQLYLNGLMNFFTSFELSTCTHELNHPF